jgi:hypothetical protein
MSSNQEEKNPTNVLKHTWWYKAIMDEIDKKFEIHKEKDWGFHEVHEVWGNLRGNLYQTFDTMFHDDDGDCLCDDIWANINDDKQELYMFLKEVVSKDNFIKCVIEIYVEEGDLWNVKVIEDGWWRPISITELLIYYIVNDWEPLCYRVKGLRLIDF